jgi:F0F1-type ATP synthase alpha subunit
LFRSDLDPNTQFLLNRGTQLTELLKQKQFVPIPVEEQVVVIYAGVKAYLDKMLTSEISKFEKLFLDHIKGKYKHILETIRKDGDLSPKLEGELRAVLEEFIPSSGLQMKDK